MFWDKPVMLEKGLESEEKIERLIRHITILKADYSHNIAKTSQKIIEVQKENHILKAELEMYKIFVGELKLLKKTYKR